MRAAQAEDSRPLEIRNKMKEVNRLPSVEDPDTAFKAVAIARHAAEAAQAAAAAAEAAGVALGISDASEREKEKVEKHLKMICFCMFLLFSWHFERFRARRPSK